MQTCFFGLFEDAFDFVSFQIAAVSFGDFGVDAQRAGSRLKEVPEDFLAFSSPKQREASRSKDDYLRSSQYEVMN